MLHHQVDPIERAHWMTELVYGTLTALIALAGIEIAGGASPTGAGAIVLVGAAATWVAHSYAALLGGRAATGHPMSTAQVGHAFRRAWPILLAAIPSVVALAGASLGLWSPGAALTFSNLAGIAVLGGAGYLAARAGGADLGSQLVSTVVTASFGVAIVLVERLIHS